MPSSIREPFLCWTFLFFFQAEDGIRDVAVTGVQTCALPISVATPYTSEALFGQLDWAITDRLSLLPGLRINFDKKDVDYDRATYGGLQTTDPEIGRASCRERV